jgi:Ni/Co efflux regulator RcnB
MHKIGTHPGFAPALVLAAMLVSGPALADKPAHAGGGKNDAKQQQGGGRASQQAAPRGQDQRPAQAQSDAWRPGAGGYFNDRHRTAVHDYYGEQFRRGHCPPGLAKKNNGCMPPGHARRWTVGQRLPGDVIFYDVPAEIVTVLGAPPAGHRYVRVARDILLITIGTGMVLDGIDGLSGN